MALISFQRKSYRRPVSNIPTAQVVDPQTYLFSGKTPKTAANLALSSLKVVSGRTANHTISLGLSGEQVFVGTTEVPFLSFETIDLFLFAPPDAGFIRMGFENDGELLFAPATEAENITTGFSGLGDETDWFAPNHEATANIGFSR